jgi:uncharacterized repeat protein (TIGR02543 family)
MDISTDVRLLPNGINQFKFNAPFASDYTFSINIGANIRVNGQAVENGSLIRLGAGEHTLEVYGNVNAARGHISASPRTIFSDGTAPPAGNSQYAVSFNLNGGTGTAAPQTVTSATGLVYPAVPVRAGHLFAGWYDNLTGTGRPYDFAAAVTEDKTLYARWHSVPSSDNIIPMNTTLNVPFNSIRDDYAFVPLVNQAITITGIRLYHALVSGHANVSVRNASKVQLATFYTGSVETMTFNVTAGELYYIGVQRASVWNGNGTINVGLSLKAESVDQYYFIFYRGESCLRL